MKTQFLLCLLFINESHLATKRLLILLQLLLVYKVYSNIQNILYGL